MSARRLIAALAVGLGVCLVGAAPASASPTVHVRVRAAIRHLHVAAHTHEASYNRDKQFGDWITQHGECDTRAVVLITESLKPVTKNQYCTVSKGRWYSYYNARHCRNAYGGAVQIDHTVPVYNVWISGAWRWTKATRVRYYNDLGEARTLVAVNAHDSEVKGGDDPTTWMPSHGKCRYLRYWVAVKDSMAPQRHFRGEGHARDNRSRVSQHANLPGHGQGSVQEEVRGSGHPTILRLSPVDPWTRLGEWSTYSVQPCKRHSCLPSAASPSPRHTSP